ncbi:MAG TPA: hypothetical protein VGF74_10600 [Thermoleophilaceae bacterium]|jgi:hypothetical protein
MRRIPRTKGAISGFLIILLGLWGGLVPFIGPYFDYAMHTDQTWQWFTDRAWLEVLPAVVTIIGGFMLMSGVTRGSMSLGAMLALAGGLWFIVGPNVSVLWNHGAITVGPPIARHNVTRMLEWVGFFYGTGALITMFSAYALGFLAALPIVDERVVGRTVATGAGAGAAGFAAGRASGRRKQRERDAVDAPTERVPATTATAGGAAPTAGADAPARDTAPAATTNGPAARDGAPADDMAAAPRSRTGRFFRRRRATTRT